MNELNIITTAKGIISIYNTNGQKLIEKEITELHTKLVVEKLVKGVYLLKYNNNGFAKFIK